MSKLIVLSIDSLFDEDMDFLRTLPNFKKLLTVRHTAGMGCAAFILPLPTRPMLPLLPHYAGPARHLPQ